MPSPDTHPLLSSPRLSRVKATPPGLPPVRRLLRGERSSVQPRGDRVRALERRGRRGTAGPFGESGGERGSGTGRSAGQRVTARRSRAPGAPPALASCGANEFGAATPGAFSGCAARELRRRREQRGSRLRETLRSPGTCSPLASGGGGGAPALGAHRVLAPGSRCCRRQPRRPLSHPFVLQSERECTADASCSREEERDAALRSRSSLPAAAALEGLTRRLPAPPRSPLSLRPTSSSSLSPSLLPPLLPPSSPPPPPPPRTVSSAPSGRGERRASGVSV